MRALHAVCARRRCLDPPAPRLRPQHPPASPHNVCSRHPARQRALAKLHKLISDSNEDRGAHLAGVPLPEVDAELLPLQQEVSIISLIEAYIIG